MVITKLFSQRIWWCWKCSSLFDDVWITECQWPTDVTIWASWHHQTPLTTNRAPVQLALVCNIRQHKITLQHASQACCQCFLKQRRYFYGAVLANIFRSANDVTLHCIVMDINYDLQSMPFINILCFTIKINIAFIIKQFLQVHIFIYVFSSLF